MGVDADDPRAREERRVTRVLELAEELLGLQRELEAAMRSGLFDIAAARYSRPSCPVSRTQYDLNMRAQTRVATREEPAPETRLDEPPRRVFQIVRADHPRERDEHDDDVAGENKHREGPRRRTNVPRVDAEEDETTQKETEGTETTRTATASARASGSTTTSRTLARKPASWFGAFPPPQLRRAESSFRSCVELAARMATVSSEIRALT
jgi:hypothetical protein